MLMVQTLCLVEIFGLPFLEQLNKNDIFGFPRMKLYDNFL